MIFGGTMTYYTFTGNGNNTRIWDASHHTKWLKIEEYLHDDRIKEIYGMQKNENRNKSHQTHAS
jgi:hypothetical protein